jgi:hypothetical protein
MAKTGSDISWLVRTAIVVLALLIGSEIVAAQEMPAYIGGALTASSSGVHSISGTGSPSTSYDNSSTESWATGVTGEAGWFFKRSLAIGVEVTVPFQRSDLTSVHHYLVDRFARASRYREQTIFAVLHYQVRATGRIKTALVGGAGVVSGNSLERIARGTVGSTSLFDPFGNEQSVSGHMLGMTAGTDLAFETSRHVVVVPQFRLLMIARGGIPDKSKSFFANLGLPSIVYRLGISVRAAF